MLAEEQCGCIIHFIDVELMMNMESVVSRESRIVRRIQHEVTIALPFYIKSRMKGGLSLIAVKNAYVARQACVQRESGRVLCGLDVTDPEPLPKEHRLWHMENALITPHISGFFHLKQTLDRIVDISAKNLKLFLSGENLMNMVDYNTGYRSYERRVQFDESQSV